ncbi:MAG: cardiolipin synthase [Cystobacterineae bacterium]|nr:cardiolipin synthase [Cystobacterineae bacterium]
MQHYFLSLFSNSTVQTIAVLAAFEAVYLLLLVVWIVMQKRSPVATLAWIFGLALLPVLGFAIYYLFGPRRISKTRMQRLRARNWIAEALDMRAASTSGHYANIPPPLLPLARLGTLVAEMPVAACSQIKLLIDGAQTFEALLAAISEAKHHIHLEYYIFHPDTVGLAFIEALTERARAGVKVRLLLDAMGSSRMRRRHLRPLRKAGAEVAFFHKVRLFSFKPRMNFRTHRKLVVVDGHTGFLGGINIMQEADERVCTKAYRDTHVQLVGSAVRWLQTVFLEDWNYATGNIPLEAEYFPSHSQMQPHCVQIVPSGPDLRFKAIRDVYFSAISTAKNRVWISTPYFVPDEAMLTTLMNAALRGIDVRILVPKRSDSWVVTLASRSYYNELLLAGVRLFEYLPRLLHAKTLLVDETLSVIGTANMDVRSFELNFEISGIFYDEGMAQSLAQCFLEDLKSSSALPRFRGKRPFGQNFLESFMRLFSPLL